MRNFSSSLRASIQALVPKSTLKSMNLVSEPQDGPIRESFKPVKLIGSGVYSNIYLIEETKTNRQFAARVSTGDNTTASQIILAAHEMAPKIFYEAIVKTPAKEFQITIMDLIHATLKDMLEGSVKIKTEDLFRAFECLLDKKFLLKVLHGDMHSGNIVLLKDGKTLGFIDFDMTYFEVPPLLNVTDAFPLIATATTSMQKYIISYYKQKFNIDINPSQIGIVDYMGGGYGYKTNLTIGHRRFYLNSYLKLEKYPPQNVRKVFPLITFPKVK